MKDLLSAEKILANHLEKQADEIEGYRKDLLNQLAIQLSEYYEENQSMNLNFICTHNSRRSHIAQLMMKLASIYYGLENVKTYSGGTEGTALNERVVQALRGFNLYIEKLDESKNPKYYIPLVKDDHLKDIHFSKIYNSDYNPQNNFVAVMVCDEADEACPIVQGASARISLPYIDPKLSDNTETEGEVYRSKVLEIGSELFYLTSEIKRRVAKE